MDKTFYTFSCPTLEDYSDGTSSIQFSTPMRVDVMQYYYAYSDDFLAASLMERCLLSLESDPTYDHPMVDEIEGTGEQLESKSCFSPPQLCFGGDFPCMNMPPLSSNASVNFQSDQPSISLFHDDEGADHEAGIYHLLKAYGEAVEMEQEKLAGIILRRLNEKACPTGSIIERTAYHLIGALSDQVDFLREEAGRNYEAAFKAFYQIFPYGRFAHFAANSAIFESIPEDTKMLHIVDFDIGNGVQWPSLIEELGRKGVGSVRLSSIKSDDKEENWSSSPSSHMLEQIKTRLSEHAKMFGMRLSMGKMTMEGLVFEMEKRGEKQWFAFNCMVGLPHMGKQRSARRVTEFLKVAKESINKCDEDNKRNKSRGVITFGDGIGWGKEASHSGYRSIFEGRLFEFQALLESMDLSFPRHLEEAKLAMECLFLTPYMLSLSDSQMWNDIGREIKVLSEVGLEASRFKRDALLEAKELVREGEGPYCVCVEGVEKNQMLLRYKGTPLVKVSGWR